MYKVFFYAHKKADLKKKQKNLKQQTFEFSSSFMCKVVYQS